MLCERDFPPVISAGNDISTYYIGGSLMDITGVSLNDYYQIFSGRVNTDIKINKWLDFVTRSQFTHGDQRGYGVDREAIYHMNPLIGLAYNENGKVNLYPWLEYPDDNPLAVMNYEDEDYAYQIASKRLNILLMTPGIEFLMPIK